MGRRPGHLTPKTGGARPAEREPRRGVYRRARTDLGGGEGSGMLGEQMASGIVGHGAMFASHWSERFGVCTVEHEVQD